MADENIVMRACTPQVRELLLYLRDHPHKNLPVIRGVKTDFYWMEYIEGKTLAVVMEKGALSPKTAKNYMLQLIEAVKVLHSRGFVHRDIKPENIIITPDGTLKLIDFDVSEKLLRGKKRDTECFGTKGFAAPEQYGFMQSDERSDIYAMGVTYNFMLTGKHPQELEASGEPGKIIGKCMQIDKERRYSSLSALKLEIMLGKRLLFFDILGKVLFSYRKRTPLEVFVKELCVILMFAVFMDLFYKIARLAGMDTAFDEETVKYMILLLVAFLT